MREFKFRAWDSEKKQMILPDYSDWEDFFIEPDGVVYQSFETGTYEAYRTKRQTKNLIVMQFTGLKDKNGKEIYEGDILKHPIEKRWFPWVIEFHGASFCLVNIGIDGYKHEPMYLTEDRVSERETIGNIYENPELLKP